MTPRALIQDLADCRDKSLVGGKAVNLGTLIRGGFPVPGGFVVTTEAYGSGRLALGVGEGLAEEVLRAYRALGAPAVAVRSSATAEDLAEASMAGQYDTFLDITSEEALIDAIGRCWASLDSPRTRSYLAEHGLDLSQVSMAVVVQRLIPADISGVLFTANPQTGSRREMLIEASWGLGEAIVSGRVQPDRLRIDRDTGRVLHAAIADKQVQIAPGSHEESPVAEERRRMSSLKSADLEKLRRLGLKAEHHFGQPQDLEWAIQDGQLYLLQSRPITTLEHAEAYEQLLQSTRQRLRRLLEEGRGPWVRHNIAETLAHATPLTWSVIGRFMSGAGGFGVMYRQAGFEPAAKVCAEGFLERIAGKAYMDLSMAGEMFFEAFPFRYDVDQLRSNPDAAQAPPTVPAGTLGGRMAVSRRITVADQRVRELAKDFDRQLTEKLIPEFVGWCGEEKRRDLGGLTSEELIDLWRARQAKVLDEFAPQSLMPSLIAAMALGDLRTFLAEHFWDENPDALASLLSSGHRPDRTMRANCELYEVAQGTRTLDQWLADNGHRAPDEFDLATPRWREQPEALSELASHLAGGVDPRSLHGQREERVNRRLVEIGARLSPAEFQELRQRLEMAQRYLPFREDGKYYLMFGYDLLRDAALEAGRRLDVGADVFHLTLEELFDALRVGFAPTHLIAQRKVEYAAEKKVPLPLVIDAAAIENLGSVEQASVGGLMEGFAVSSGVASGPARIVRSPQEAGDLGRGYVLVCPSTDPNWTPLFVNASALVLECGGTLSHGAVVAREMNIPAVVLAGATSILREGESVTVDGRSGKLTRADVEPVPVDTGALDYHAQYAGNAQDTRVARTLVPPPPGQRERAAGTMRNRILLGWGSFLLLAWLLPEQYLYGPTMAVLDLVLWPAVRALGKVWSVAVIASVMAAVILVLQLVLTDNGRLREAKRRAALLKQEAWDLPPKSPRRQALMALAAPVQMRVFSAALAPLAALLGPMVMVFLWFPARVDPASWNAAPGSAFTISAQLHSGLRKPVRLGIPEALNIDYPGDAQSLPPICEVLERQLAKWKQPSDVARLPWDVRLAAAGVREQFIPDLEAYLERGVPPQALDWSVRDQAEREGRYAVSVSVAGEPPVTGLVVLGDRYAPAPKHIEGNGKSIIGLDIVYHPPAKKPVYLTTFSHRFFGKLYEWSPGWLSVYLLAYLPVMFAMKYALRVA